MTFKHTFYYLLKLKLWALLLFFTAAAQAIEVSDLFSVQLRATVDSEQERESLMATGLGAILNKLCLGECKVSTAELIKSNKYRMSDYTLGYKYIRAVNDLFISIDFNKTKIKELLHDNKVPYLNENRPAVVFWLAIDEANDRAKHWAGDNSSKVVRYLESKGESLSLPFVLPLFDYSDLSLQPNDIGSTGESLLVKKAAKRYNTDVVVVGELSEFAGEWKSSIKIYFDSDIVEWSGYSKNMLSAFDNIVEQVVGNLIKKYAVGSDMPSVDGVVEEGVVILEISGLNSLTQYNRVIEYLRNLPGVANVQTDGLVDDMGVFLLMHNNSKHAVLRSIKLDRFLEQEADAFNTNSANLKYRVNM